MKRISIVAAALLATGCATTQIFDREQGKLLEGQTLVVAKHDKPDFVAQTAGKAMFGALGGAAMISAGNELVKQHKLEDPAPVVRDALSTALVETFGMQLVTPEVDADAPIPFSKIDKKARYALEVETTGWGFGYFATNWTHYRVMYGVRAKLFDTKTKKVLAAESCSPPLRDTSDGAPTYDELLADDAARLRKELEAAASYCVRALRQTMFRPGTLKPLPAAAPAPAVTPAAAPAPATPPATVTPASAPAPAEPAAPAP